MPTTHLLYLHGFRSSPQSFKARLMAEHMARHYPQVHWWCPQLPPSPAAAMRLVLDGIAHWPRSSMAVMGSSLGGFYATYVAEHTFCRAVLINPAVNPARDLERYIGEQTQWHAPEESFYFAPEYVGELHALTLGELTHPERYLALLAKGDEVLDWREMHVRYSAMPHVLQEGGDHALSNFADYLPQVLRHLGLQA
ncbi:YqiA/YcfP family alpha/beta fold hydrolase [Curvibacter sp. CHRR-16]|uniref:YqiA/YcfP family alpha/beta fold hydrolase n=1 Tax=Curvibacter sp. CHRR-16 TaxID=2835872 RepID=UPI0024E01304|nr:YqiA/YcfP family alpha/beta fold hydrolase [Curvibacter sp. CHRR-16]